jgi:stage V sporulation protein R
VSSLYASSRLTSDLVEAQRQIKSYAKDYGLNFFEVIFEMVDHDQINSIAALGGFPIRYSHWRFGMNYDQISKGSDWGLHKIYEMVINTDPAYAYLMKSNNLVDQKMVIAHVYGHVDFFKNNYWFSKTNRKMLDQMANHAVKIQAWMDSLGRDKVERFIDDCLSIENLIDSYSLFSTKSEILEEPIIQEPGRLHSDRSYMEDYMNPKEFLEEQKKKIQRSVDSKKNPSHPEKDVLLFLLENAPLETWEYDILSIIRQESYYFIPQAQTKIMNEGWASYWHSKIMTEKALKDSEVIDFADRHASIMSLQSGKLNPYKIGLELYRDIEDRWNRGRFGKEYEECENMKEKSDWNHNLGLGQKKIFEVRRVCNDVTFIDEYLTEEFVERHQLYTYSFNRRTEQYEIMSRNFKAVKEKLLFQLTHLGQPFIYVLDGNFKNQGELLLWHKHQGLDLDLPWMQETLRAISAIWKRPVYLDLEIDGQKKIYGYRNQEFVETLKGC